MRALLALVIGVPFLGGGWLWLRDSSLVAVEHVYISGVKGSETLEIRQALDAAARRMTTMDFNEGVLRAAVAPFLVVREISASTSFPHTVHITVSERPPVAALSNGGQRTAIAQDGTVLGAALLSSSLPTLTGASEPMPGTHVQEASVLSDLAVLDAGPAPLLRFVARVFSGREGLTLAMRNGLLVYFGNDTRPHAKWLSLARVLAAPSSAGAWYIDVRVPERPAAGISGASNAAPVQTSASDPTAAALAARLATAIGGGGSTTASQSEASSETSTSPGSGSTETSRASNPETPPTTGSSESNTGPSEASKASFPEASRSAVGGESPAGPAGSGTSASQTGASTVGAQGGSSAAPVPGG